VHESARQRKAFTTTPRSVLATNKYRKLPKKCNAIEGFSWLRSKL